MQDTCICAAKEKEIEEKLNIQKLEWESKIFQFAAFKKKGNLLLKGNETSEIIMELEDSMILLSSLLNNR